MRRLFPVLTFALLFVLPAAAQDTDEEHLARLAMEAKLKTGDVLREKGDLDGALKSYREAIEIYDRIARVSSGPAVPPVARVIDEEEAIRSGLQWLASVQQVDGGGGWDADKPVVGAGGALYDVGVSGLALLAFLGSGESDRTETHGRNVREGLRYLLEAQDTEGCFGARVSQHYIYNHAYATLAVVEAYAQTQNPRYKEPAQRGVDFILRARNPYLAWRYEPRGGENDTSVTGICVLVLRSAENAGLTVDKSAYEGALAWVDKMTEPEFGRVGYTMRGGAPARVEGLQDKFPPEKSESMTACGLLTRIHCGENARTSTAIQKGVRLCLEHLPVWNTESGEIDLYYWLFATRALLHVGGSEWRTWSIQLADALLAGQRRGGDLQGSWDPADAWGPAGGRIYSTAMAIWILEAGNGKPPAAR